MQKSIINYKEGGKQMKKFMGKLPVMIIMWVVTITLLTVMIVMAARPVSYDWAYKCDEQDIMGFGEDQEIAITFEEENELEMFIEMEGLSFEMNMWYLREGNKYGVVGVSSMPPLVQDAMGESTMSSIEFYNYVKECKADRQLWREMWATADSINAFKCEMNGVEFVCNGAIAFTVVFSVLSAIGLTCSIISTVLFIKSRKKEVIGANTTNVQSNLPVENNQPQVETAKVEGQIEIDEIQE